MEDWLKIKTEYITTDTSYRKLAEKYGVHYRTIAAKGKEENWKELRAQSTHRTLTKSVQKIEEKKARQAARVGDLADKLMVKLEQAIEELDQTVVTHKTKTRDVQYGDPSARGKPTREVIKEEEQLIAVDTVIDRGGLRLLSAALKDLKFIKDEISDLERREREARIEVLRRQNEKDEDDDGVIEVVFAAGPEEWNE